MIDEQLRFGIDLGIGSCGWAVLRQPQGSGSKGEVVGMGSWCFDVPETDKERTPTNQIRRGNRLLRRVIRRRRNRMSEIRRMFHSHGLLPSCDGDALKQPGHDPWTLRARGLDKPLRPVELAVALAHIAKSRGFKSAAKRKAGNTSGDDKKMLAALDTTRERLGRYRTIGEMFALDGTYSGRKRNRDGIYDRTAAREDLENEVRTLFASQRRLGSGFATILVEERFTAIAFRQLPMQDSERLVGFCPFERGEKRAAKSAPSFERFRLLLRLVNLRVSASGTERALTPDELIRATADLGKTAKLSATRVRALVGLPVDHRFTTIKPEDEGRDIAARAGEAMPGTSALRGALGETLWIAMMGRPEHLDAIAQVLSFYETSERIAAELSRIDLDEMVLDALLAALNDGKFARFKGAAHISTKAARNLLPYLMQGRRYDEACVLAGYDHAASSWSQRGQITTKLQFNELVAETAETVSNPIARKAITEGLKQLWAMRNRWGLPSAIHLELGREVGNSIEKRREMEGQIEKATAQRQRERDEVRGHLELDDVSGDTLLRYRLWKEQAHRCCYTDQPIDIRQVIATDNSVQVDHILPWSRFGDDSFNNKTLCLAGANQRKGRATPFEWLSAQGADAWAAFVQRIETNKSFRGFKKRNYLLKNAADAEERFRSRNLNDTRYAARVLAEAVRLFYAPGERQEKDGIRRVFTRPGALTAALRQAWGVESLKKVDGKRLADDRHHALDALVVAAVSEAEVQRLTRSYQQWEQRGLGRPLRSVDAPWDGFRHDVEHAHGQVFVTRPERRRARGEGHAATIRQIKQRDGGTVVFERQAISNLKEADLHRIKDLERNGAVADAIRKWIASGRPADTPPLSPHGDPIVKVRLKTNKKLAVPVRGGTADRGEMVRVDVFSKPDKRGRDEWYLVPIYPHQVMDGRSRIPNRAVVAYKDEADWPEMGPAYLFRFSLYPRSYVQMVKSDGVVIEGYFARMDRSTGSIRLAKHNDLASLGPKTGAKTLLRIQKYAVDRFGSRAEVKGEVRTWRGVACTSPSPPG